MAKIKSAQFYANQDVFSTMRSSEEKRAPVLQRDMEKNALKSVEWYTYGPVTWARIRDYQARCFSMPHGFFYAGPTHKRNCVEIRLGGPSNHLKQWNSIYGTIQGRVTAVAGAPGTLASRSSFFTSIGADLPNLSNTNSKFRLVFKSGDLASCGRNIVSYNQATGLVTVYDQGHPAGLQKGDPFPGWGQRLIRVGDAFVVRMMHEGSGGSTDICCCRYESTSRVYREPFHDNSPSIYKSIRFKYSHHWPGGVAANLIGDDPNVPGLNHPIADSQALFLRWKEITYLIEPTLVPVMPSSLFPATSGLTHRRGYWPAETHKGPITAVTPILLGNYTPPGRFSMACPIYVWEINYSGDIERVEFPAFYRPIGIPKGFHVEMWHQKTRRNGPWPSRGCNPLRSAGGTLATVKAGEWIYFKQTTMLGMPVSMRNPVKRHDSFRIRFRNFKDGGLSLPSRQKVSLKYRQIKGRVWNIPILEE